MSEPPTASIIVFFRYHVDKLGRVLDALLEQDDVEGQRLELILIDSSDDPRVVDLIDERRTTIPIRLERSRVGLTPGAARNRGVALANGRFLLFCEADVVPGRDWVSRRLRWHMEGKVAVAQSWECAPPRTRTARLQVLIRFSSGLPTGRAGYRTAPLFGWSYDKQRLPVKFDESLDMGEDGELNARLVAAGTRVWFDPDLRVQHIGLASMDELLGHQTRHGIGAAQLARGPGGAWVASRYNRPGLLWWYPAARWVRTFVNSVRSGPQNGFWFLVLTPWSLRAFRAWARGYLSDAAT